MKRSWIWIALIAAGIGTAAWLATREKEVPAASKTREAASGPRVSLSPVTIAAFRDKVSVAGNVEAVETALVAARIPGVLDAVYVDEGDSVKRNETKLFQTDSVKLTQAVEIAERQLEVSECAVRERRANLERIEADLAKAKIDYERFKRLYEEDRAVTLNAYELQESRLLQLTAALSQAKEAAELSRKQVEQARSGLAIATKDLEDSLVLAPIDGVVVRRMKEPGELAGTGVPVLRIEDPKTVEVSCFLVAEYYGRIRKDDTVMVCSVRDQQLREPVSYISPVIHPSLRTFEVKCKTHEPPHGMVPGALVDIDVVLEERTGLAVPSDAVQTRSGERVVFTVTNGRAAAVPVQTGLSSDGLIEIKGGDLSEGDEVVTEGQNSLEDGTPVAKGSET